MEEMIDERQNSQKQERSDLFSSLLEGNNADTGEAKLTISELIGRRFVLLNHGVLKTPQGTCLSFCLPATRYGSQQVQIIRLYRPLLRQQRIHYASRSLCLRYTRKSKKYCINTYSLFYPTIGFRFALNGRY